MGSRERLFSLMPRFFLLIGCLVLVGCAPDPVKWDSERRSDAPVPAGARLTLQGGDEPVMVAAWAPAQLSSGTARGEGERRGARGRAWGRRRKATRRSRRGGHRAPTAVPCWGSRDRTTAAATGAPRRSRIRRTRGAPGAPVLRRSSRPIRRTVTCT